MNDRPLLRREDRRLLTGSGQFIDNLAPDALHAAFLRSEHAHARIASVNVDAALATPGVVAVYTAADLPALLQEPLPVIYPHPAISQPRTPSPLPTEVCYAGQPVVMVVARTRAVAEDAVDAITVEYEPLPVAIDLGETAAGRQGPAHDGDDASIAARFADQTGDVDAAMRAADHVLHLEVVIERASGQPLEGRGVLAGWDLDARRLEIVDATQFPLQVRPLIARALGLNLDQIDVRAPDMGGGFGTKGFRLYPEEVLVPFAAIALGRQVKWVEDRGEHLQAAAHQRSQIHTVTMGVDRDGRLLALDVTFLHDMGAYCQFGLLIPLVTAGGLVGPYAVENVRVGFQAVYTNTIQVSPYRGSSTPFSTFVMERAIDHIARSLTIDRAEVRRRNLIHSDQFPYCVGLRAPFGDHPITYDSGNYVEGLEVVLDTIGWPDFPEVQRRAAEQGRLLGIGLASYVEGTGIGPYESARVTVDPSGSVQVAVGSASSGQGHETVFAEIAARALGVDPGTVNVTGGDSRGIPFGYGTFGSRSAVVCGNAVHLAGERLAAETIGLAAAVMRTSPESLVLDGGFVRHVDDPTRAMPLGVLAQISLAAPPQPGKNPGLSVLHTFAPPATSFASGTHACIVEVDPDTFGLRILRYVAQHDCGPVLNRAIVDGQVIGGVAHGIAETFYERRRYDQAGRLLTRTFHDYLMPYATEIPRIELLHGETPTANNPLGIKGAGEAGIIPVSAALVSAVEDALGIAVNATPLSPQELFRRTRTAGTPAHPGQGSPGGAG